MVKALHHPCLYPNSHPEAEALCVRAPIFWTHQGYLHTSCIQYEKRRY